MNEELTATIESAITEGESHLEKLHNSNEYLKSLRPITPATLKSLDEESVLRLDQFVYRFTKLQDSMARRLLPSLYALLEADTEPRPFLDILSRLEQLDVLPSVQTWQRFRNLRNNLAHDYPESLEQTAETLSQLLATWDDLEAIFTRARDAYRDRR
ncbi:MAG: hypothetical protein WD492_05185 [Alkalispirochaeta sp.]